MAALILGLASNRKSLRGVESLSAWMSSTVQRMFGIRGRISDTTLSEGLAHGCPHSLHRCLVRLNLAEQRRGNLCPHYGLPCSVVALDGKHQATLSYGDLLRIARRISTESNIEWTAQALRHLFGTHHPNVQIVEKDGRIHGLVRYHRVTLTSHPSHPCMLLEPIPGDGNEVGQAPATLRALFKAYRNTSLCDIITADAGNTSIAVVETILAAGKRYLLAIKGNQPETEKEADRIFATMGGPSFSSPTGKVRGRRVTHHLTVAEIPDGTPNFPSARAFLRVQRHVTKPDGEMVSNDYRTFITNVVPTQMPMKTLLALVRSHWRCENNGHWTSDTILGEDKKRVRYARGPRRIAVVAICRMIAQNILGQLRVQSRQSGTAHISWEDILFHVVRALTGAVRHRSTKEIVVCP